MKIAILGSMQLSEKMLEIQKELEHTLGHEATISEFVDSMLGKTDEEKEILKIQQKNHQDAMKKDLQRLESADAVLVINLDKNGVANYIGGNTFLELGHAHLKGIKMYFYNPIPEIPYYKTELEAFKPVILNGDLSKIGNEVKKGKYKHYKGTIVEVMSTAFHSEDLSEYVVYNHPDPVKGFEGGTIWIRPKEMFLEIVTIEGEKVPRFKFIE